MRFAEFSLLAVVFYCITAFLVFSASAHFAQSSDEGEEISKSDFPDGFIFGAGTSSYQVEGAPFEDGRGLSNWDVFSHIPGKIKNNDNGDIADDHYHRYLEDIELVHSLGVKAYRFSLSWARILPRGRFGEVNKQGIIFYNNIINNLIFKGIEPFVTIFHHELPQELEDRYGGWLSPSIQEDFGYYAEICFESFGDRVKYWATINEPNFVAEMGYVVGIYPPGRCSPPFGNCSAGNSDEEPLTAVHNMLISHAMAVDLYRRRFQAKQCGIIGITPQAHAFEALTHAKEDLLSVKRAFAYNLAWILDPLVYGDYPNEMREILGSKLPRFTSQQQRLIKGSLDFIGINHYTSYYVKDCTIAPCSDGGDRPIRGFLSTFTDRNGVPIGDLTGLPGMNVVPKGMEKMIDYTSTRYSNIPIYVTENGYSSPPEHVSMDDLLLDFKRVKFHKAYLAAALRAIRKGGDVRGYFVWALMDNFEWSEGYGVRFGLHYVDRQTLERTPKLSAKWYSSFLSNKTTTPATDHDDAFINCSKSGIQSA